MVGEVVSAPPTPAPAPVAPPNPAPTVVDCLAMAGGAPTTAVPPPGCGASSSVTVSGSDVPTTTVVPAPGGGGSVVPGSDSALLTSVERALMFSVSVDGSHGWLVPAFRFETDNGDRPAVTG